MRETPRAPTDPTTGVRRVAASRLGVRATMVVLVLVAPTLLMPPAPQGWVLSGGGLEARRDAATSGWPVLPGGFCSFDHEFGLLEAAPVPGPLAPEDEVPQPAAPVPDGGAPTAPVAPVPEAAPTPEAQPAPPAKKPGQLVFGRWPIADVLIVDGDTLRIKGQPSVRVRAVDCEEVFRSEKDRAAATKDFDAYAKAQRGEHPKPRKYGTPLGEAATTYLRELASKATHVRLERDGIGGHELDTYDRRLAHIFLELPDREILVAEELIRLGYSPYFVKYGRSLRFDERLRKAEDEAREAERGLWGDGPPAHYPDYPERLRWWHQRAEQIERWRARYAQPDHITLGTVRAEKRLVELVGKPAVVLGLLSRVLDTKDGTKRIAFLGHRKKQGFPLVFFDKALFDSLDRKALDARFIEVRGVITLYRGKPQMVVERAEQISTR